MVTLTSRAAPFSLTGTQILIFAFGSLVLATWAILFAALLVRFKRLSTDEGLSWAALCHVPLVTCVVLVDSLYRSDSLYHVFAATPTGTVLRPLALVYLVFTPLALQVLRVLAPSGISRSGVAAFLFIAAVAVFLRFDGLAWGLPGRFHPDEYSARAIQMFVTGDLNPHFFFNPSLMIYAIYGAQAAIRPHAEAFRLLTNFLAIPVNDPRNDFFLLLVGRVLSASAGTLTVGIVYLAAKEVLDRRTAVAASALLAVALLNVRNSHFATNDVTAGLLLAVSLLFSAKVAKQGAVRHYVLAGLFGGLAASTKYTAAVFLAAFICAHIYHGLVDREATRTRNSGRLIVAIAVALVAFVAASPYSILAPVEFLRDVHRQLALGAEQAYGQFELPTWLLIGMSYAQGFGLIPTLLAILGFAVLARRNLLLALLIGAIPLLFMVSLAQQRYFFARFILPSLPAVAVLAGHGVAWLSGRHFRFLSQAWLYPIILAVALAQGAATSVQFSHVVNQEDTRTRAAEWIGSNTQPGANVAVEVHSLMDNPWGWGPNSTSLRGPYWARDIHVFWPEREEDLAAATNGSYNYVVVTSWGFSLLRSNPEFLSRYRDYEDLGSKLELRATFAPGPNDSSVDFAVDDMYSPFYHLFDRVRPGPTVYIYSAASQ